MSSHSLGLRERRSFLSRLAAGAAVFGGTVFGSQPAAAQSSSAASGAASSSTGWRAARHTQDDWLDQIPGSHRFIIDSTSPQGLGNAMLFANNFFVANQNGYGLGNADAAVVLVMRHNSTPFAFSDAMWAKYGKEIGDAAGGFDDPKTKTRPVVNVYNSGGYAAALPNNGVSLEALIGRGVHFAVCQMATRRFAGAIAAAKSLTADAVYTELTSNLVRNSHMAPAGIVAVNRAQERGYTLAVAG
jgi:intracellular sulfur oxidation DsrE/DsrF family protein